MNARSDAAASPDVQVSVTEVRNALRCPRVFALGRALGVPVAFPVGSSSLGAAFHRVVARFCRTLDVPPPRVRALDTGTGAEAIQAALAAWLLDEHLVPELVSSPLYASMPAEVDDLAEALRQWCAYLSADLAAASEPCAHAVRSFVVRSEGAVQGTLGRAGHGPGVRVTGRFDALYRRVSGAFDVVEYKLTDEANAELDEAQVALYRTLLRQGSGIEATPVLLRFAPELSVVRVAAAKADSLVQGRLGPLVEQMARWAASPAEAPATARGDLCAVCPVRSACRRRHADFVPPRDTPPADAARPGPDPSGSLVAEPSTLEPVAPEPDHHGHAEAAELADLVVRELAHHGVHVTAAPPLVGPRLVTIEVLGTQRQRVGPLDAAADDVRFRLADRGLTYHKEGARRRFTAPRRRAREVSLPALLAAKRPWLSERAGRFVLGEGMGGEVITGDLGDGSTPHLLVGGQAGSGKSVLLRALVTGMAQFHQPSSIRFTLVDPKRVTFGRLRTVLGAHLEGPVLHEPAAVIEQLDSLAARMEQRYELFERRHVEDIEGYNELAAGEPGALARHVLVLDEFQDLVVDPATKKPFLDGIARLGAKARAAGIHLVLATQRPDQHVVPGVIKANLGGKIALRVATAVNSRIILDQPGAELLLGNGDFLADLGRGLVRGQGALV
jgi:S-DNA-T family DNA segregation ATPase FtsK/SpoIIIE